METKVKVERKENFPTKTRGKDYSIALAIWFTSSSRKE